MTMGILAESAIRITVLAFGVAVVLRLLRIRSPRLAHRAWTAVVVVMLALPAMVAWGPTFEAPLLGPAPAVGHLFGFGPDDVEAVESGPVPSTVSAAARAPRLIPGAAILVTIYAAGVVLLLARLASGAWRLRAIRLAAVEKRGQLTHSACVTPITVGILDASVILPPDWTTWSDSDVSAVLAHETEHVRRRDPLVVAMALLNRAVFWFHPLAWWLPRQLSRLSEQACDAAVVSRGHDSDVYASCLLRFARRATEAGGRVLPMATAMSGAGLQERLRLLARPQARPSRARLVCVVGACAALIVVCAAAVPAAAQRRPTLPGATPWPVQTSAHFEIFHAGLPADRVGEALRDAEAAYEQLSAAFFYEIAWRIPIILVSRDRDQPTNVAEASDLAQLSGAPNRQRLVLSLESLDRQTGIVVHELTHQYAFEIMPATSRMAPLLIEGLAEYQRGVWQAEDLRLTRAAAASGAIPPVAALEGSGRGWAHALFDYVRAEHGVEGIRQLVFALRARDTLAEAIPMAFGVTMDQFDERFRGYVTSRFAQR